MRSVPPPAGADGGGCCWYRDSSCATQRLAWRRETRLLTAVAVPATTAVRATPRSNPGIRDPFLGGGLGRFELGEDGLHRDAAAGDELPAGLAQRGGDRRRPAVLPHEHGGRRAGLERVGGLLEVVVAEQARRRALELVELVGAELLERDRGDVAV